MAQWNKDAQAYRVQDTTNFEVVMLADEDGNPINTFGSASNIPISAGQLAGYSYIHKFGGNPLLNNSTEESMWDEGGLYPWATMDTAATTLTTNAEAGNNGAEITIQGLNENWELTTEVLTLDGTAQTTQNSFTRVFRGFTSGSQAITDDFTLSKSGNVVLHIIAAHQQTEMALYTVPAGKTAYMTTIDASTLKNESITVRMMIREYGGVFRCRHVFQASTGQYNHEFTIPKGIPEKTDIDLRALASNNNISGYASFELILVDN